MKTITIPTNRLGLWSVLPVMLLLCGFQLPQNIEVNYSRNREIVVRFPDILTLIRMSDGLSDHIASCSFIQLETNPQCRIGEITKTLIYKERLYILERGRTQSVFIFDLQGKWISTLPKIGQGSDEYQLLTDIFIDPNHETLNLVDSKNKKIMRFNLDGETLLGAQYVIGSIDCAEKLEEGILTYTNSPSTLGKDNPRITYYKDSAMQTPGYTALPIAKGWEDIIQYPGNELWNHNGEIYYPEPLHNKIYKLEKDSIFLIYTFDFKRLNPEREITFAEFLDIDPYDRKRKIQHICRFSPLRNGFVIEVNYESSNKLVFITENYKKIEPYVISVNPLVKPLTFGYSVGLTNGLLITQIMSQDIAPWVNNPEYATKYPEATQLIRRDIRRPVTEEDNPILCLYRLR